jgi:hypothetical protein
MVQVEKESKIANALRVNLNEERNIDLVFLKKYHGIESDSDMIRFLIRKEKKEIVKEGIYNSLDNT